MSSNLFWTILHPLHSLDTCSSLCYTHNPSVTPCHFFIVSGGDCMLGNYELVNGTGTIPGSAGTSLTAYYNESKF